MSAHCRHCGATEHDTRGCRYCDPGRAMSRVARSEVSFGPIGRTLMTLLLAGSIGGVFYVAHHSLDVHALAWWVLAACSVLLGPVVLLGIWKPVRRPHRH